MGILGTSSSLAADIEKATSEVNTQEKWGLIMDVCDKVINGAANAKECLKIIVKRLNHGDPHVVMQAITLLDACVSNCGKQFHLEVASRDFETEFKKLLQKSQPKVNMRLKLCLKKWAEADFKSDPQLNLIPSLYQKLRSEGHEFSDSSVTPKREPQLSKDPNVVSSQQEEEDIAKAIELSLKESKTGGGAGSSGQSPKMSSSSSSGGGGGSLYPTAMLASVPAAEPRKVRALYDFEAAEDNELTFQAGEIIMVLDDSDPNWWKGQNQRGEGLFPSNFVTSDLNAEPEEAGASGGKSKKSVQFSDEQKKEEEKAAEGEKDQILEINEEKIDRLLHLLHEADPEDPSADSEEMLQLEQMVNQMGPLIDTELERVDRKHAQLTQLSGDLVDAINLYHTLMREPDRSMMMGMGSAGYGMPAFPGQAGPMPGMYGMPGMFNANMPPGMYAGMGGMPSGLPPYGMPHLRHDMAQMGLGGPSSLPPPQAQQIPVSGAPLGMQGHPQMAPPQQHMPNMSIPAQLPPGPQQPQQPSTSAAVAPQQQQQPQHPMMNLGHMQSPLPQSYSNPISPPPIVSSAPTTLPNHHQQQPQQPVPVRLPPQTHQPQVPQTVSQPGAGAFQPYASPPTSSVHQQQAPLNGHPVPPPATAPPPNHHPHHQAALAGAGQMPPQYQSSPLQPYMPQMGPVGSGFPPAHHMLGHMMPPGTNPLSINTATSSPQNIPIYQQQR